MNHMTKHPAARPAFTLIEMVTSLAITSILLLAIGSAMVLTGKALPSNASAASGVLTGSNAADKLAAELRFATYFTERTSKAVTFLVPDRDGDGKSEIIRYAWTGVAGDPLTRQINGSAATTVVTGVALLTLTYDTASRTETYPGPFADQPEQLLAGYMPTSGYSSNELDIQDDDWPGQYFQPVLPANAQSWRVSRVLFKAKKEGSGIQGIGVHLFNANSSKKPTGNSIQQVNVNEPSSLTYITMDVPFTNVNGREPGTGLCLLLGGNSSSGTSGRANFAASSGGGGLLRVQYDSGLMGLNLDLLGAGTDIDHYTTHTLLHQIYGKVNLSTFNESRTRTYLTAVGITMQTNSDALSRIDSRIALANQPESLAAYWSTTFDRSPTLLDDNGDGQADWGVTGSFDTSTLGTSLWSADRTLATNPAYKFNGFTTVDVKLEDTTTTGGGAGVELRVESTGATYGSIDLILARQANGTQTLTLRTRELLVAPQTLLTIAALPAGVTTVRLDVKASADSVSLTVNDLPYGKFTYKHVAGVSDGVVRVYPGTSETGARFDELNVRVAE